MKGHTLQAWVVATRPWSFTASAFVVIVSLAYMEWVAGGVDWGRGLWAVGAIVLFHAAGNTWSDWHDYRSGIDAADTHGVDTLTSGRFRPGEILRFSLGLYAAAIVAGVGLMLHTGPELLWVGLPGLLGALLYPPLKRWALGDGVILLNYCLLPALGTAYVATGRYEVGALWAALPVGLLVAAILHANNTRDMQTDRRAGASTLAQALGVGGAVGLYLFEVGAPFVWVAVAAAMGRLPLGALCVALLLPMAVRNCRRMCAYRGEGEAAGIAHLDQMTAQLQLLFSLILTLALLVEIWLR